MLGYHRFDAILIVVLGWGATRADEPAAQVRGASRGEGLERFVELIIRSPKERYYRREPIVIECELVNKSEGPDDFQIEYFRVYGPYFDPSSPDIVLHIGVTSNGKPTPTTQFSSHQGAFSGSHRPLFHGARDARRLTINSIFDMTMGGEYRIQASIPVTGRWEAGRKARGWLVKSNEIRVFVKGERP